MKASNGPRYVVGCRRQVREVETISTSLVGGACIVMGGGEVRLDMH